MVLQTYIIRQSCVLLKDLLNRSNGMPLGDFCKSGGESSNVNLQAKSFVFRENWSDIFFNQFSSFPVLHCLSYIALTNPSAANGLVALALCLENKRPCTLETAKSFLVGILQLFIPALIASCRPKSNRRVTGWRYLDQSFNIQRGAQEKMKGAS